MHNEDRPISQVATISMMSGPMAQLPKKLENDVVKRVGHEFGKVISELLANGDIEESIFASSLWRKIREGIS